MSRSHIDHGAHGFTVLALMEEMTRSGQDMITAQDLLQYRTLPRLSVEDVEYLMKFLLGFGWLSDRDSDYETSIYRVTPSGKQMVWYCNSNGRIALEFPSPNLPATQVNVGQGAQAPFQMAMNTGSGTIYATQTNHIGPEQQARVLELLDKLSAILERMEPNTDRDVASTVLSTLQNAAKAGAWEQVKARANALMTTVALVSSIGADGPEAYALAQSIFQAVTGA
ncbi:hypothetical protein [Deinococcus budaensis]|uniref:Uncharacterized protein n=1 Tax=Deinococcus budaensis TaxID=1665626 RepID=A0A7W8GF21_9DEIO|nr:hypothetical protein [Deinococcus budaensis]MBB5234452.1 hypothetical protein [Deinococcus budaensis]